MERVLNKEVLFLFFSCAYLIGLIFSPFVLSVAMWSLAGICVLDLGIKGKIPFIRPTKGVGKKLLATFRQPDYVAVTLFFFLVLLDFWQTEDQAYWLARLRLKIPFLVLPLVFYALPKLRESWYHGVFVCLLVVLFFTCIGIAIHYLLNIEAIQEAMKRGHPIPTPRNHIRFSLILAMGVIGGITLWTRRFYLFFPKWEPWLYLGLTVFLFFFCHFLSVRSGLLALYAGLFFMALQALIQYGRLWPVVITLAAMMALPYLAYRIIPSFQAKIDYTIHDWLMYQKGEGAVYADAGRITSWIVGWQIFREHPLFGVGAGNLKQEVTTIFAEKYPQFPEALVPHNQFLFVAAGSGLLGLFFFLIALWYPFFHTQLYQQPLALGFYGISLASFMVEHTIENSIGIGFFVFFLLFLLLKMKTFPA
ncbi:MAG TPA: O-antigen ligase family protein [Saprospiraceae bacterium]|nr:O-antigen ligase family protein [Saprospiraceae bacterium]HMQ85799.1 O-antigen ligase family protein [Saprospiraceae bacterium]